MKQLAAEREEQANVRQRSQRRGAIAMSPLTELLASVDAERGVAMAARQTGASDAALDRVHALLQQSLLLEEQGDSATGPLLDQAAWLVTDSFAMGSELGRNLLRYAQAAGGR